MEREKVSTPKMSTDKMEIGSPPENNTGNLLPPISPSGSRSSSPKAKKKPSVADMFAEERNKSGKKTTENKYLGKPASELLAKSSPDVTRKAQLKQARSPKGSPRNSPHLKRASRTSKSSSSTSLPKKHPNNKVYSSYSKNPPAGKPLESSRTQAVRAKREYMAKLHKMHRILSDDRKKNNQGNNTEPKTATANDEASSPEKHTEEEDVATLKEKIAIQVAKIKADAIKAENRLAKRMSGQWLIRAKEAAQRRQTEVGPFKLVRNHFEIEEQMNKHAMTPEGAAGVFLLSVLSRQEYPGAGYKLSQSTFHPDCTTRTAATGDRIVIRKHTMGILRKFHDPEYRGVLASFVAGTTPENGYEFDKENVRFKINKSDTVVALATEGKEARDVYIETSGAFPSFRNQRFVRVQLHEGKWLVRSFNDLIKPVRQPEKPRTTVKDKAEYKDYKPVFRDGRTGIQAPLDMGQARLRKQRMAIVEKQLEDRHERHQQAVDATHDLADKLTSAELNRKFKTEPQRDHVIVELGSGVPTKTYLPAGKLYKDGATEVKIKTIEDENKEITARDEAARLAKEEQHKEEILQRINDTKN